MAVGRGSPSAALCVRMRPNRCSALCSTAHSGPDWCGGPAEPHGVYHFSIVAIWYRASRSTSASVNSRSLTAPWKLLRAARPFACKSELRFATLAARCSLLTAAVREPGSWRPGVGWASPTPDTHVGMRSQLQFGFGACGMTVGARGPTGSGGSGGVLAAAAGSATWRLVATSATMRSMMRSRPVDCSSCSTTAVGSQRGADR